MAKIDLKPLSLKELNALKLRVEKAIERHERKRKASAVAELKAKAKELGLSLSDLTGAPVSTTKPAAPKKKAAAKKKTPAEVTHRHPQDPSKTWVGRGPRPDWLKQELLDGKQISDFKI